MRLEIGGTVDEIHFAGERGEFRVRHVLLLQQLQLFVSRRKDLIAPNGVMEHVHAQADHKDHGDSLEETEG